MTILHMKIRVAITPTWQFIATIGDLVQQVDGFAAAPALQMVSDLLLTGKSRLPTVGDGFVEVSLVERVMIVSDPDELDALRDIGDFHCDDDPETVPYSVSAFLRFRDRLEEAFGEAKS